jgi:choloylglycine hydrolase
MKITSAIAALFLFLNQLIYSCTTFCINTDSELVFGKNYDWMIGYGLVLVNKSGVDKVAFVNKDMPARWVSKYGSVTFNQFGREFPNGGMNEAGLVIELMWLDETKFPEPDDRLVVGGVLQWIQYQLDNSASIEDIIASDKNIRITQSSVPLHYLAADKTGKCVSVEFLDGKLVYHTGETMMVKVLTNDTYEKSVDYLKKHEGFGGNGSVKNDKGSLDRFVKACSMVKSYTPAEGKTAVDYGFEILKTVDQDDFTKWSIVYDIKNRIINFKTYDNSKVKNIDLNKVDFDCNSTVRMIDINSDIEGNVNASMIDYTYERNRRLIEDSYSNVDFLKNIKTETKDNTAKYPEKLTCRGKSSIDGNEKINSPSDFIKSPFAIAVGFLILSAAVVYRYKYRKRE